MKIIDYKCRHTSSSGVEENLAKKSGLSFPEAHCHADDIVTLAKIMKNNQGDDFCAIPFCHTVEGEAMGAIVNLGDEKNGPRAKEYICQSLEEVLGLDAIDFSKGRIAEVIKAASALRSEGEEVVLLLSGPFTILNVLIDPTKVFKVFRKQPEIMEAVFNKLQKELINYVKAMHEVGVRVISYADSSGGLNILGPKFFEKTLELFTVDTLKTISEVIGEEGLVLLCPKTTLGLISSERAEWGFIEVNPEATYRKVCMSAIGKAQFIGETCLQNVNYAVRNGKLRTVLLRG